MIRQFRSGFCFVIASFDVTPCPPPRFAYRARMFLQQHELDGLDIDWEFPRWALDPKRGEKGRFVVLLDKLSTALRVS